MAAQKVYGSIGRSRLQPEGCFAHQQVRCSLASGSDFEWLPQELVLYADALFEQQLTVTLPEDASFLSAEIVRLGRTAAGETLQQGRWRSSLTIQRRAGNRSTWELADRVELGGAAWTARMGWEAPQYSEHWCGPHRWPWVPKQQQHCWRERGPTAKA